MGAVEYTDYTKELLKFGVPDYMRGPVNNWINYGEVDRVDFLWALVSNDLRNALLKADDTNVRLVLNYVKFFYNEAPMGCWGDRESVLTWASKGGLCGGRRGGARADD